jgi:hypothetical protein
MFNAICLRWACRAAATSRGLWLAWLFTSLVIISLALPASWGEPTRPHEDPVTSEAAPEDPPAIPAAAAWEATRSVGA